MMQDESDCLLVFMWFGAMRDSRENDFLTDERVTLNVGGRRHETTKKILRKVPHTRLSYLSTSMPNYDRSLREYFFDRHPDAFMQILNYYRTGKLHYPTNLCGQLFEEELRCWGIESNQVEPCCWMTYTKHRQNNEMLEILDDIMKLEHLCSSEQLAEEFGYTEDYLNGNLSWWQRLKPQIWQLFENPDSSPVARAVQIASLLITCVSIIVHMAFSTRVYTIPILFNTTFKCSNRTVSGIDKLGYENFFSMQMAEYVCNAWFTLELLLRFLCSPKRSGFFKSPYNLIDLLATLSFYVDVLINSMIVNHWDQLHVLNIARVFRLFKVSQHSTGIRIFWHTVRASSSELVILIFSLFLSAILFSCLIYFAERSSYDSDYEKNSFQSIFGSMWWAVNAMTTIGPGDYVPKTFLGQLVGAICALTSIMTMALPVPIFVNNLSKFYSHEAAHRQLPKQRRRVLSEATLD